MPMFDSDEAFEAYVARQQQEAAEQSGETGRPPQEAGGKGPMERFHAVLAVIIPLALAGIVGYCVWTHAPDRTSVSHDPWDNILGAAAWVSGREYNADADTLSERMTLRLPGDERGEKDN